MEQEQTQAQAPEWPDWLKPAEHYEKPEKPRADGPDPHPIDYTRGPRTNRDHVFGEFREDEEPTQPPGQEVPS